MSTLVPLPDEEGNGAAARTEKGEEQRPRDSGRPMEPWLKTIKRRLEVKGQQGAKVTMTVTVYRDTVWVATFDEPFFSEAILELADIESLVGMLTWAGDQARRYQEGNTV